MPGCTVIHKVHERLFAHLVHVRVTLCLAPTRRASVTGECCLAAGLSVSSLWTNDRRDRFAHPAFLFTSLSFLGLLPASPHSRGGHGLSCWCEMSPVRPGGLEKSRWGLETAVRCDAIVRGSIHERVAWLVDGAGSAGGVLLVPTSSFVRMTVGFIAVSD